MMLQKYEEMYANELFITANDKQNIQVINNEINYYSLLYYNLLLAGIWFFL